MVHNHIPTFLKTDKWLCGQIYKSLYGFVCILEMIEQM